MESTTTNLIVIHNEEPAEKGVLQPVREKFNIGYIRNNFFYNHPPIKTQLIETYGYNTFNIHPMTNYATDKTTEIMG